jgi:C-terminal processing protease CtpA/Prc
VQVARAQEQIDKAPSLNMAMSYVAAALDSLNDSHTFFKTPARPYRHDYGFRSQMIGDRCFVTHVRPQSDAEAKGLKPGHEILAINGFRLARESLWRVVYVYNELRPQLGLRLNLKDLMGEEVQLDVLAQTTPIMGGGQRGGADLWDVIREVENENHLMRGEFGAVEGDIEILKLRRFDFDHSDLERVIDKARARKAMILDLRGNPGGHAEDLKALVGSLFSKDVKIGDLVGRDKTEPMIAEAHDTPFAGKLVVLVDSLSGSSSEVLARVVQLEKRGVVMGDRSSGSVMVAAHYTHQISVSMSAAVFYGTSVTDADLIMTDGRSLEHTGVVPDELIVPTAADLLEGRDPVLAHAIETLGGRMSPREAGKMFPYEWSRL